MKPNISGVVYHTERSENTLSIDVTPHLQKVYRRVTNRYGGDDTATFTFTTDIKEALSWMDLLNATFEEYISSGMSFTGFINSVQVVTDEGSFFISLDSVFNDIKIIYRQGNSTFEYDLENDLSIEAYGRRQYIFTSPITINTAVAQRFADNINESNSKPQIQQTPPSSRSNLKPGEAKVTVNVLGFIHKLKHTYWKYASTVTGLLESDYGITEALAWIFQNVKGNGETPDTLNNTIAPFSPRIENGLNEGPEAPISFGLITPTEERVVIDAEYVTTYQLLDNIFASVNYDWGCYQSKNLSAQPPSDNLVYRLDRDTNELLINGVRIPAATTIPIGKLQNTRFGITSNINSVVVTQDNVNLTTTPIVSDNARNSILKLLALKEGL